MGMPEVCLPKFAQMSDKISMQLTEEGTVYLVFHCLEMEWARQSWWKACSHSIAVTTLSLRTTHWCSDNPVIALWDSGKKQQLQVSQCHNMKNFLPQTYSKSYPVRNERGSNTFFSFSVIVHKIGYIGRSTVLLLLCAWIYVQKVKH